MPASYLLATRNKSLEAGWRLQIPDGRAILTLEDVLHRRVPSGRGVVVILDVAVANDLPEQLDVALTVGVGEPHSKIFEGHKIEGRFRHAFSYEESRTRLGEVLPLLDELAERTAALELLMEKTRRADVPRPLVSRTSTPWSESPEIWDFLEGAVENLGSRDRLLGEFRRASRYLLRASHTVFFLRDETGFRADRGASFCPASDPVVAYLSSHPMVLDGIDWPGPSDPIAELAARNRLALWGARLLIPLHENGHLLGMIACGVRDDGQPYDEADKSRAVFVGRLLRQFLAQSLQLGRLSSFHDRVRIGERYLPHSVILSPEEEPPRQLPVAVRALIGEARRARDTRRLSPSAEQPYRASAGIVTETGGAWAFWEEASGEVFDRAQHQRVVRTQLLRDLALTLNHEIGNALVSLAAVRHAEDAGTALPEALRATVRADIDRLERVNVDLVQLAGLTEIDAAATDLRALIEIVGARNHVRAEVGPAPVTLVVAPRLIEFSLEAILRTVAENRPDLGTKELTIQLRSAGEGEELTALVSIKGKRLELEGILPEVSPDSVPNQGRLRVFIAKEVIRLHGGEIHAGPGLEGTEILISIKKW